MSKEPSFVRLADPSRVVRVMLARADSELTITLSLVVEATMTPRELRFRGASDVHFRGARTELKELVLLLAEDISGNGWEGARFRVKDSEEEFISFLCREIEPLMPK